MSLLFGKEPGKEKDFAITAGFGDDRDPLRVTSGRGRRGVPRGDVQDKTAQYFKGVIARVTHKEADSQLCGRKFTSTSHR
ncbi:hypothetical protein TNCV_4358501 [Trichonephila clavipes]|nr:hypothetical protein TNCV_4358501 [Trichonephila clavipes]